jgi:hypothetical protein
MARDKLTALKVERITAPGRYGDGAGLYLQASQVGNALSKSWLFRYRLANHVIGSPTTSARTGSR